MSPLVHEGIRVFAIEIIAPFIYLLPLGWGIGYAAVALAKAWKKKEQKKICYWSWLFLVGFHFLIEAIIRTHS